MRSVATAFYPLAVALVTMASSGGVRAQDASVRREARAEFDEGERAFEAGETVLALQHFERAFALVPHDAVRFNLAVCYEALGRVRDAIREYEAAAASPTLDARTRARAAQLAEEARAHLGRLVLEGPEGREVTVDATATCVLPCRLDVDPGAHEIRLPSEDGDIVETAEVASGASVTLRFAIADAPRESPSAAEQPGTVLGEAHDPRGQREAPREGQARDASVTEPSWLTALGGTIAGIGALGIVGFGAGAWIAHEDCVPACGPELAATGELLRDATNASIAVAAAGAVLIIVDLVLIATGGGRPPAADARAARRAGLEIAW